jgi:hypothetical protein
MAVTPSKRVRISAHGARAVELKIRHKVPAQKVAYFDTRCALIFPASLAADDAGYGLDLWYRNLRAYLRLHPPSATLDELANAELPTEGNGSSRQKAKLARRQHRLFAQRLRDELVRCSGEVRTALRDGREDDAHGLLTPMLATLDATRAPQRRARAALADADHKLATICRYGDEWCSLEVSSQLLAIAHALQSCDLTVPKALHSVLDNEARYRVQQGYRSADFDPRIQGAPLLMRMSRLKKLIGSALHLELRHEGPNRGLQDLLFAIAASVAMLWAVAMQIVTWWYVGNPVSPDAAPSTVLTFTVVAVVAYAMKDKIKEGLRGWFRSRLPVWLYDRKQLGLDGEGERLTWAQESTRFSSLTELTPSQRAWYDEVGALDLPVDAVSYSRRTTLRVDRLRSGRPDISGLTEVIRIGVDPWRTHMDAADKEILVRGADGRVRSHASKRLYPVLLLVEVGHALGVERRAVRVMMSRDGIERIEDA